MIIHLITVGNKMPRWVQEGYQEYAKRLPPECNLKLVEIAPGHRGKSADIRRTVKDEGERMLKAIPKGCRVVVLDVIGKSWSTEQLSTQLGQWMSGGSDIALLVGGPEGLAEACLERADGRWSLSALTLPHPLVRVIISEQLYRAWSLLQNHPYHRA
jgi:23S rRNA (pseudouridine1915-N3)-methyltransferase